MEVCDPALAAHAARVARNAEAVAVRLGWSDDELEALRLGAALHDVGKVNVRHDVLTKPGRLDDWELAEIRAHPVEGLWLLSGVA
jgi:HD-GYP domain-containing protein (c-di-GMP phosphodiesterase class II)